jgi:hypothetical protein
MWVHTLRHRLLRQRQTRVSCSSHVATSLRKLTGSYIAQVLRTGPFGTCPELLATRASLQQGPHRAQIKGSIDSCPRAISGCILCGTRLATSNLRLVGFTNLSCSVQFAMCLRRLTASYIVQVLRTGPFGICPELIATLAPIPDERFHCSLSSSDKCVCTLCGTRLATSNLRLGGFKFICLAEFNLRCVLGGSRPPTSFKCSGQVRLGLVRS